MPCNHQIVRDNVYDFIDSRLEPSVAQSVEKSLDDCSECMEVYHSALAIKQMSHQWQDEKVPEWNRASFVVPKKSPMSLAWVNWASLATSFAAILMVVFRVEIVTTDHAFTISFSGQATQEMVARTVDNKVSDLAFSQVAYIDNRFEEQQYQQIDIAREMYSRVIDHSRNERRQELKSLMTGWMLRTDSEKAQANQKFESIVNNQIENNQQLNRILKISSVNQYE